MAISRRSLLRLALGFSGASAALLAACAPPTPAAPTAAPQAVTKPAAAATPPAATAAASGGSTRPTWFDAAKQFSGKTINVLMGAGATATAAQTLLPDFSQATGIKVNVDVYGNSDYTTKVQTEITGRSGNYDLITIFTGDISRYAQAGALVPLDDFLNDATLPDFQLSDYPDSITNSTMRFGGKIVTLAQGGNAQIAFYRKDLLDAAGIKPPQDWPAVYDAARKLRTANVYGLSLDLKDILAAIRFGNALPAELTWLDKSNRLSVLRDPRTAATLDVWHKLYAEDLMPKDVVSNDLVGSLNIYLGGQSAMLPLSWPSSVPGTEDPKTSQVVGKTLYSLVPGGAANASGWSWGVSIDSKQPKAAYLVAGWFSSADTSRRVLSQFATFDVALRKSALTPDVEAAIGKLSGGDAKLAGLKAMNQAFATSRFAPTITVWGKVNTTVAPFIQKGVVGELSAADALQQAADAGDQAIADAGL